MEKNVVNALGIKVQFPYKVYEQQKLLIEAIIKSIEYGQNAIIESPTGTGKTLCLLCASLAYLFEKRIPGLKIIYTTRTHGQLNHFINEFKKVPYYSRLKEIGINLTILGSRDKLCIHSQSSKMKGTALDGYCKALVHNRTCIYYNGYKSKDYTNLNMMVDVEDLATMGKEHGFCPFYAVRDAHKNSNFILMPYNYLFCQSIRDSIELDLKNAIIIIDEAHNIDEFAERLMSFTIQHSDVIRAVDFLERLINNYEFDMSKDKEDTQDLNKLLSLLTILQRLNTFLCALSLDDKKIKRINFQSESFDGDFVIFDTLSLLNILTSSIFDKSLQVNLESKFSCLSSTIATKMRDSTFNRNINFEIQSVETVKNSLLQLNSHWFRSNSQYFYSVLRIDTNTKHRTLLFECMNSSYIFTKLISEKIRNLILTSGTLSPIDNFISNISNNNIKFPIVLENEHIISSDRVWVGGITSKLKLNPEGFKKRAGDDYQQIVSTYSVRCTHEYMAKIGMLLEIFVKSVPGGILCFFSSYTNMTSIIDGWKSSGLYHKISSYKKIFIERLKSSESESIDDELNSYKKVIDSGRGALFFAVFRGKIAEGIDFPNDYCRGIFISGIPYPNPNDFRVSIKMNYLSQTSNNAATTKSKWYLLSAIKAINQAIGRCIRHVDDYGAIFLADVRYEYKNMQSHLPKWVLRSLDFYSETRDLINSLDKFFIKFKKPPKTITIKPIFDSQTELISESDDDSPESIRNLENSQELLLRSYGKSIKRERTSTSASAILGISNDDPKVSKDDNPFASWSNATQVRSIDHFTFK